MPSKRSSLPRVAKKKLPKELYLDEDDDDVGDNNSIVPATPEPPRPVFETFTADINLQEGLSIIRSLGGGKYEVVNLTTVNGDDFSSEEMGRIIKSIPARLGLIDMDDSTWNAAKFKCKMAVDSAEVKLFRFLKLPIELRYKIYDYTLLSSANGLKFMLKQQPQEHLALALIRTCRQIHQEAMPFFYRNNFMLDTTDIVTRMPKRMSDLPVTEFIREVTTSWEGYDKDRRAFAQLAHWPQLRILNLMLTWRITIEWRMKRQRMFQDDDSIDGFNKVGGFDALASIRGLDMVTVETVGRNWTHNRGKPTDAQIAAFEAFLTRILTQPKPQPKTTKMPKIRNAEVRALTQ